MWNRTKRMINSYLDEMIEKVSSSDKDVRAVTRAEIPVERLGGPLLMFSAKDDQIWPSDVFAARVVERLESRGFRHPVEHYTYDDAGHFITRPFVPTSDVR